MSGTGVSWSSSGGVGGTAVVVDDLELLARETLRAAAGLAGLAEHLALLGADHVLACSAPLAPGSFLVAEHLLVRATAELVRLAARLALLAARFASTAAAYRAREQAEVLALHAEQHVVGALLGATLPAALVLAGGLQLAGVDDERLLCAHPWLVQDAAAGLSSVLPLDGVLDEPQVLRLLGVLEDDGHPQLSTGGPTGAADGLAPGSIGDLLRGVARRQGPDAAPGEIGLVHLDGAAGRAVVVQLPGTDSWSVRPGADPRDLTTNVHAMADEVTTYQRGVELALAGVPGDVPVLLVGHSQGGLVAAELAADAAFRRAHPRLVVLTAGAPLSRVALPTSVPVLSLEGAHDVVPRLDGEPTRDLPDVTTMTDHADRHAVLGNHDLDTYAADADLLPVDDVSLAAWTAEAARFLDRSARARTQTIAISRAP